MNQHMLLRAAIAIAATAVLAAPAIAQDYPNKPVKLVVPFPPAGGTDVLSRAIAQSITTNTKRERARPWPT